MLKLHLRFTILVTLPFQALAYRAFTLAEKKHGDKKVDETFTCYCKKVDSKEDCYGPQDSKRSQRFYRQDGMCCKVKMNVDVLGSMKHKVSGYKKVDMEMCQETYEVPAESCCYVELGELYTLGLHIKKAISKPRFNIYEEKTLPAFEMDDITGGGEADQPWSADDVRYLLTNWMSDPNAPLYCNKDMHEVIEDRNCKLFEKKPFLSSGCCCPLADVAHAQQCFRVAGASKETVIQQEHWVTKYRTFEYKKLGPYAKPYKIEKVMRFAEDVPHDNIKDQDANMPAELVDVDPKENELPEFAVNGKKWTWMKVEDQYASKCLEEIQDKPYIREPRDQWEKHKQKYGAASCPRVQYTRICPPGEGLYIKQGIPDGKCLWFHENNTEEMQLKFKPQYPSRCPRGYTFGDSDWPGVEGARCQCSNRTIDLGNRNYTICDFD